MNLLLLSAFCAALWACVQCRSGRDYLHRTHCPQDSYETGVPGAVGEKNPTAHSKGRGLAHKPEIKIGFLGTFHEGRMIGKLVVGAVPLAVHDVNVNPDILPNHRLTFVAENVGMPDTSGGVKKMTELRNHSIKAFIGPDESCYAEALVADAWNLPMITYMCYDPRVSRGDVFRTFARTLPSSSKVSKSVIALLKYFEWTRITLIVSETSMYIQTQEVLVQLAKKNNITATTYMITGDYMEKNKATLRRIVQDSFKTTRIYVLLTDTHALIDFVGTMDAVGLLAGGEYAIISVEEDEIYNPHLEYQYMMKEWDRQKLVHFDATPFRSVLMITPCAPQLDAYQRFQENVQRFASQPPLCIPFHPQVQVEIPPYAAMAYDAVFLYARAATEILRRNLSLDDGAVLIAAIRNKVYRSVLGYDIRVDENGEAEGNYTVLGFANASDEHLSPIGKFSLSENGSLPVFRLETEVAWLGAGPPVSEPQCGFFREKCISKQDWRSVLLITSCTLLVLAALIVAIRHYRYEYKLAKLLWKIDMKDVLTLRQQGSRPSLQSTKISPPSVFVASPNGFAPNFDEDLEEGTSIGFYKGNVVFIKPIYKKSVDLTRSIRKELIQMREMRHENINPFIGACVDPPNVCIFTMHCARGSLEDVLKNEDLTLDGMFISSLVADLLKGMIYIHDSEIGSHGNLKSSNCLVDSRWVLQVTDFGLHEFKCGQVLPKNCRRRRALLWKAPELLRHPSPPLRGTQKGDIYSFGIVLYEIIGRAGPWGPDAPSTKYIIDSVINPPDILNPPRPPLEGLVCADYVVRCLRECWDENPELRPDFRFVNVRLREMQAGLKPNIFDNMIAIMEKYAYNLESLVQERTYQLLEEKKKTENLLLRMLPKPVAEQLKRGEPVQAESFESVTIYFSDIVGFTELSAKSSPLQVVNLLNSLYTCFDSIIENYNVYKVETIGDAYMVVSGLPLKTFDHAAQVACMALHLLAAIAGFEVPHRPGERLKLRIGIHSGPCVAGVVGLKMPRYCLFGDTVNTASRMESTGEALRIHISETCKKLLDKAGGFNIEERGMTMIKGKGEMRTYWLQGKVDQSAPKMSQALSPCPASTQYAKFSAQFLQPVALSSNLRSNSLTGSWSPSTAFRCQGRTCSTGGGRLPFFKGLD